MLSRWKCNWSQLWRSRWSQVSPLYAWCSDPKLFCERVGNKCKLKRTHAYYAQVQGQMGCTGAQWCDFVNTKKECHLKESPLSEVTGLGFRRSFGNIISDISLSMLQLNLHHHVQKLSRFVILQRYSIIIKHLLHISQRFDNYPRGYI